MAQRAVEPRIVVGVDGSPESRTALRWATRLAADLDCDIEAITVWQAPTAFEFDMTPVIRDWNPQHDFEKALAQIVDEVFGPDRPARLRMSVLNGYPARCLIDRAESATMLVVGSRGHGAFAAVALGSVSQRCVEHARCPVVVVKADDEPPSRR